VTGWSTASRAQRASALARIGTTTRFVLADLRDAARGDPALRDELYRCRTEEEREQLAFEVFGDQQRPQPTERSDWVGTRESPAAIVGSSSPTFRTPDWPDGRLPPLEDIASAPARADPAGDVPVAAATTHGAPRHPGGRPLEPVMPIKDARRLQADVDRFLAGERDNGLTQNALAQRHGISRQRVVQALELRSRGYDLSESPPEFRAVSGRDGMVRWPPVGKPSKS
jgi:hypothetical protein